MDLGRQILSKIPVSRQIGQELHEVYHRDFSHRHIGSHEDKKVETLQVSKRREDLDHPLVETRGGDRGIGSRDINIPMDKRSGKSI
jgi:hypothetical protein